ncbi:MAG: hypothetical protein A2104_01445 [Candidatus Melainabacteria bacterium GWF2_32_7]|nr:MAG: hypothetical protein A2104_01445 [Candidatus Melainabacteria bacterium GWF2_32_7]
MTAEKVRVYDLAKKLGLPNKEVIDLLAEKLNVEVKSHASTITKEEADKLTNSINAAPSPQKTKEPAQSKESPKTSPEKVQSREEKTEIRPPQDRTGQRPPYDRTGQRPPYNGTGQRPPYDRTGQRPPQDGTGQRPPYDRTGQRPSYNGTGQRPPYDRTGQRPPQDGTGQRPPYDRTGQRPPYNGTGQRPPYDRTGQRPPQDGTGQRPPYDRTGQRPPYNGTGQRPPYDRTGQRPPQDRMGQRPDNRPQIPTKKPVIPREDVEVSKTPGRREVFGKKKDKHKERETVLSKEEKLEQTKLQELKKKKREIEEQQEKEKITQVVINVPLSVGELASKLDVNVADVIKQLMMSGFLATVNQTIDTATAKNVSEALGFTVIEEKAEEAKEEVKEQEEAIDESKLEFRAPVVTIMGHVDHGKTTLLDSIRSIRHKIVNTEVGGITQSIGAYTVRIDGKKIVFIDTPGHEAFTAMRARGAQATDIAILVVAADDGIMPQTIEAISHAKAAKVPIIVAVNKIDKAGADPDRVLQQLTEYDLVPEKWGGDTVCVEVSALQGTNIDTLLEMIILVSELEDLKADYNKKATGVIIEAKLDKGKGAVATLLIQAGTLKVGDYVVAGNVCGKVRALLSDEGERINEAGPSTPVEILGLAEVPQAGDKFEAVESDKEMKTIITHRKEEERTSRLDAIAPAQVRKEMILQNQEQAKDLNIIIKANTHGSAEAVSAALQQLVSKQIFVKIVHVGIGDISEADVMLADASNAIMIGFAVKEDANALRVATNVGVDIRKYDIIYQILDDIEKTMLGLLQPEIKEVEIGTAEVRQIFSIGKTSKIAGCYVLDGKIIRNKVAKVIRDGKEIYKGVIDQLKRFKDDVKEVASGYECGISFSKFNDIQEGDIIKVSTMEEIEREVLV